VRASDETRHFATGETSTFDSSRGCPESKRYVQNHCIVGPGGAAPASAGLGELWFDSVEAAEAALATDEWKAVIDDAATFMDMDHVTAVWAEAHQIL
jgi:uncharacterized protein (TIGR02118 family)